MEPHHEQGGKLDPSSASAGLAPNAHPRRIKRGPLIGACFLIAGVITLAILGAIFKNPLSIRAEEQLTLAVPQAQTLPDMLKSNASYGEILTAKRPPRKPPTPVLGPPLEGDWGAGGMPAKQSPFHTSSRTSRPAMVPTQPVQPDPDAIRRQQEEVQARKSTLFVASSGTTQSGRTTSTIPGTNVHSGVTPALPLSNDAQPPLASLGQQPDSVFAQNLQSRKEAFLRRTSTGIQNYVPDIVRDPISPYEVKASTVLPIVLLTGINSDLPGDVTAQVREQVFDTATGNHLLIPQGTKVYGRYDSTIAFGQERVLVVWHRLLFPDGSSMNLKGMPGVDLSGYAGLEDEVDHHWGQLIGAVVLSSVLAGTTTFSQGSFTNNSVDTSQVMAANAGQQINRAGQRIVNKYLNVQPTITIRPGFSVNVMVNKDLILRPYEHEGGRP